MKAIQIFELYSTEFKYFPFTSVKTMKHQSFHQVADAQKLSRWDCHLPPLPATELFASECSSLRVEADNGIVG